MKPQRHRPLSSQSERKAAVNLTWKALWFGLALLQLTLALAVYFWLPHEASQLPDPMNAISPHHQLRSKIYGSTETATDSYSAVNSLLEAVGGPRPDPDLPQNVRLQRIESEIKKELEGGTARSCRWYRRQGSGGSVVVLHDKSCQTVGAKLVAYNQADHERTWCGQTLPASAAGTTPMTYQSSCRDEPARILPTPLEPTADASGMPPIRFSKSADGGDIFVPFKDCNVPCEPAKSLGGLVRNVYIVGTDWRFIFSMEGIGYYPVLDIDPEAHLANTYFATTNFKAEVPLPYFSWAEYNITDPPVDFDKVVTGASFVARNCGSRNHRESLVKNLMEYIRVDSVSSCMHNADPPNNVTLTRGRESRIQVTSQYKLHLAFENSRSDDYITEKMWATMASGSLPVYFGAYNVKEHIPPDSVIYVDDFNTTEALGLYLQEVMKNKTLYYSYHEWKKKPLPEFFVRKYNFTHTHSTCRICRWSYSKKWGLGWDHETQTVRNLAVSRKLKLDEKTGVVRSPFRESWWTVDGEAVETTLSGGPTAIVAGAWLRNAFEHDGVVDLHFDRQAVGSKAVYRMEMDVKGSLIKSEENEKVWQDENTRVTIVTTWAAPIEFKTGNTVEVTFDEKAPAFARVRVILEGVDKFHKTGQNHTYYFGSLMTKDFLQPVELFLVESTAAATS